MVASKMKWKFFQSHIFSKSNYILKIGPYSKAIHSLRHPLMHACWAMSVVTNLSLSRSHSNVVLRMGCSPMQVSSGRFTPPSSHHSKSRTSRPCRRCRGIWARCSSSLRRSGRQSWVRRPGTGHRCSWWSTARDRHLQCLCRWLNAWLPQCNSWSSGRLAGWS